MFKWKAKEMRVAVLVAAVLLLGLAQVALVQVALAQDYRFNVAENRVDLYIEGDGSVWVVYDLTFVPEPGSHAFDVVDVGMPNNTYRIGDVRASIDGIPLTDISNSPYVQPGVAVELEEFTIPPGQSGTLHLEALVSDLIYQDSDDSEYASIEFSPTWFDSEFVQGPTRMEVNFHLPPGVTADEPRYHKEEFTEAYFLDDRVVYSWVNEEARGDRQYVYGASFPKKYLAEGVVQKPPAFNFSGITDVCCSGPFGWFVLFGIGWVAVAILGRRSQKRRKLKYMPPALSVEGTGVKRGLTAVEAAILLEAPLNKVVTMILFGLVKKGIITVESEKPLRILVANPIPKDVRLWYYERRFLGAIRETGTLDEKLLREMIIDLIGDVNKKLTGFSRRETKAYYEDIAARAWKQVEAADTPEVLGERWGDGLEWTMLDDDWDGRTRRVFHDRPVVLPHWWWFYQPWASRAGVPSRPSAPVPSPAGTGTPVTLPTLPGADFANTVVTGVENAANTVVSSIEGFTSGVTKTTNPPPKPSSSSSRSSGGYSCACACACAGCACACAGGGR
jgi:hypothetical protein